MLIEQPNSDLGGYQMGPNKKDAVLQTTEMLNSVFATAGSYPHEGGYVYVRFPSSWLLHILLIIFYR